MAWALPESFLRIAKSSGRPPMNSPMFSPMMLFPLEADALPGSGECREHIQSKRAEQDNNKDLQFRFV